MYLISPENYDKLSNTDILLNQINYLLLIIIFFIVFFWTYFILNSVLERKN